MAEKPQVTGRVEKGVTLLTVCFGPENFLQTRNRLSHELTERYHEFQEQETVKTASCVVEIRSEMAGKDLVRALFELWHEVVQQEGEQVICVNYPLNYIDALTALGLPALSGFSLAETKEEAMRTLTKG